MKKAKEEIQEHIKHIIQTSEEEFEKSFNGSVVPSSNDYNNLKRCIIERIKPFQDQLVKICEWDLVKESPYAEGEVIKKTLEDQNEETQRKINELIK
jgi:hypothetical protein